MSPAGRPRETSIPYQLPGTVRKLILARDGHQCRNCGTRHRALQVHHLWPKQFGVDHSPANLITLCRQCHASYHPETQGTFFRDIFPALKRALGRLFGRGDQPLDTKISYALQLLVGDPEARFRSIQKEVIDTVLSGTSALGRHADRCRQIALLPDPRLAL